MTPGSFLAALLSLALPCSAQAANCQTAKLKPATGEIVAKAEGDKSRPDPLLVFGSPKPVYPKDARQQGLEGTVLVQLRVVPDGRAESSTVLKSSGHPMLDESARVGTAQWCFSPHTVEYLVEIPITFVLHR